MNEAFMRGYYDAYNSEDEARLGAYLADDVVLVSAQGEQRNFPLRPLCPGCTLGAVEAPP